MEQEKIVSAPKLPEGHNGNQNSGNGLLASTTIRLLAADDHPVVLHGLTALLKGYQQIQVVQQLRSGVELISRFGELLPDIAIFDLQLHDMDGVQVALSIREKYPKARIIIFTAVQREEQIYRSINAGVRGYLPKNSSPEDIVACIFKVFQGYTWIPPAVGAVLAQRCTAPQLTRREREVLIAMAAGKSNREIGLNLKMSEGTVKVHVTHILEKLKVEGRTEALGVAFARGLVTIETARAYQTMKAVSPANFGAA